MDVSAIVLSVKDLSTILLKPSILLLALATILLQMLEFAVIILHQMNGRYALPTQLAVEVLSLVPTQSLAVLILKPVLLTLLALHLVYQKKKLKLLAFNPATTLPLTAFLKDVVTVALMVPTALET